MKQKGKNITWVDALFGLFPNSGIILLLSFCFSPFVLGLVLAFLGGFAAQYLATPALYLAILGLILTLGTIRWGSLQQLPAFRSLRYCFVVDKSKWNEIVRKTLQGYGNFGETLSVCSKLFVVLTIWGVIAVVFPHLGQWLENTLRIRSVFVTSMQNRGWFDGEARFLKFLILVLHAIAVSLAAGTAYRSIFLMPSFLFKIRKLVVLPIPSLIKRRFEHIALFYTLVSIAWGMGVCLIIIFFHRNLDYLTAIGIMFLFLLGIVNFILPQLIYIELRSRSLRELDEIMYASLEQRIKVSLFEKSRSYLPKELRDKFVLELRQTSPKYLADAFSNVSKWVYPIYQSVLVFFAKIGPIMFFLGQDYLVQLRKRILDQIIRMGL